MLREVASLEVTSIRHRKGIEKTTWRTYHFFIDVESRIDTELLTSNQRHPFQVDLLFIIDEISTNFQRGISMFNWWRINEDVLVGKFLSRVFTD